MNSNDLDYKSSALNSWVLGSRSSAADQPRRVDVDDDASSMASGYSITRSRRGGSIVRERSYMIDDTVGPRIETSRSYMPTYETPSYSGYPAFSETPIRTTVTYPPQQTSSLSRNYYQTDYGATSAVAGAPASYFGGTDTRNYYGGDSMSYGYSSFGSRATNDPSQFRRAQSVSDFTPDRSLSGERATYNSAFSSPTGQFQSRFLDKVRARKSYGDDQTQYRSRFLAPDSGSSRYYSSRRNYSSDD